MPPRIDNHTWRSPNHNARNGRIRFLVIHSCEGALPHPRDTSLPWLCSVASEVSCHYYVCRDSTIFQLVDDSLVAWGAGICNFAGITDWNDPGIQIELEHHAGQTYTPIQRAALDDLCYYLIQKYTIAAGFVVTHRKIAYPRGRRSDPTDWLDSDFALWVKSLYSGAGVYRATHPQAILEAPRGDGRPALDGQAVLSAGEVVDIDGVNNYFGHLRNGVGFVPMGILERV